MLEFNKILKDLVKLLLHNHIIYLRDLFLIIYSFLFIMGQVIEIIVVCNIMHFLNWSIQTYWFSKEIFVKNIFRAKTFPKISWRKLESTDFEEKFL